MSNLFRAEKVVSSLPSILQANTLYYVRVGSGFDLFLSDNSGSIAHKVNPSIAQNYPPNLIIGTTYTTGNTTNLNSVSNRLLLFPFSLDKNLRASEVMLPVGTASGSNLVSLRLFDSNPTTLLPENLIFLIIGGSGENLSSTQAYFLVGSNLETRNIDTFLFEAHKEYWWGFFTNASGGSFRAMPVANTKLLGFTNLTFANGANCYSVISNLAVSPNFNISSVIGSLSLVQSILPSIRLLTAQV